MKEIKRLGSHVSFKRIFSRLCVGLLIGAPVACFSQQLPIKPARTITFTTNEGSYMNVDISPDGKTLAFDLLGDLYTLPVSGGKATQITRGMALNISPAWSPDGKKIAYISDRTGDVRLHIMNVEGTFDKALKSKGEQQDWTPYPLWAVNGNYIAWDNINYRINGGEFRFSDQIRQPLRFSADGNQIYYFANDTLLRYDKGENKKTAVSPVIKHQINDAALSPDFRWFTYVVYSDGRACLIVRDLDNNTERILIPSLFVKYPNNGYATLPHYSFSPDSKDLLIGYGGKIHRIGIANGQDHIIPFTANVKVDMGALNYNHFRVSNDPVKISYTRSANASPDGKHLVFSALNRIYIKDLPNGKPRILAPQAINQYQPIYSPDGKWVAYVSWCDTTGGFLWRVPASGGKPEQLTQISGQYQRPAWSPTGECIAVIKGGAGVGENQEALWAKGKGTPSLGNRDETGIGQLELVPMNGGPIQAIADSVPLGNQVSFANDGKRIFYVPSLPGEQHINTNVPLLLSKDLYGENIQPVAGLIWRDGGVNTFPIKQQTISPDGRFIVYSKSEDLYLVLIAKGGKPTVLYDATEKFPAVRFASGVDPHWEQNGKVLSWSYGNRFYRVDPDKIMAEVKSVIPQAGDRFATISVKPGQAINLNITVPQHRAYGTVALKNVRIITMRGNKVIEHGTIIISDGRFSATGPGNSIVIPKGAKIFDLKGKTVMPGLVDLHLHMQLQTDIFPQQSWIYLANLAYGVTTARDPSSTYDSFGYTELLESGQMEGPRLFSSGKPCGPDYGTLISSKKDAEMIVSKRKELGGTFMKQYTQPTRLQREWVLQASKEAGLNMTNEGSSTPIEDIAMLKDGSSGIEHNPDWGDAYKDITMLFAKSGTYLTPTLIVRPGGPREYFDYKYWYQSKEKLGNFTSDFELNRILNKRAKDTTPAHFIEAARIDAEIRKLGGHVTLGSHGEEQGIGAHDELWALQMGGLSNMQALQAATIMGAQALGVQKDLGSIEVGKIADLIILNKNPLDDIHNSREIKYVMKDGILYDGDTLDELWPVYKRCPEWRLKTKN